MMTTKITILRSMLIPIIKLIIISDKTEHFKDNYRAYGFVAKVKSTFLLYQKT